MAGMKGLKHSGYSGYCSDNGTFSLIYTNYVVYLLKTLYLYVFSRCTLQGFCFWFTSFLLLFLNPMHLLQVFPQSLWSDFLLILIQFFHHN